DSLSFNLTKNDFVNKIARIEYFIQNKKIDSAKTIVNSISTNNPLEKELLDIYTLLFQTKRNKQKLTAKEEELLLHIARKNQFTQSIASPLARTIAKQILHIDIYDSIEFIPEIKGTISSNCTIGNKAGLMVQLVNMDTSPTGIFTTTDSSGSFIISGKQLNKLSSVLNYKLICIFPDSSKAQSNANTLGSFMQVKGVELYCQTNLLKTKKSEDKSSEIPQNTKIYPNPSNGIFTIENGQENSEAIVYDLLGKIVFTQKLSNKINIDLSTQPKGVYFIKIIGAKSESFKLILE
ncbi:MAG: T9SS type A sorting domain-containing protein, partial [Bacteroidia bacterium]|nr:T9SS type A sorting domain-containing protein [Bacteroidia bacterium]